MSRYEVIIDGATVCREWEPIRYDTIAQAVDSVWVPVKAGKRVVIFDTIQSGYFDFWLARIGDGPIASVEVVGIKNLNDNPGPVL